MGDEEISDTLRACFDLAPLGDDLPDPDRVDGLFDADFLHRHAILPLSCSADAAEIAFADPLDDQKFCKRSLRTTGHSA